MSDDLNHLLKKIDDEDSLDREDYEHYLEHFDGDWGCVGCGSRNWDKAKVSDDGEVFICTSCITWPDGYVIQ